MLILLIWIPIFYLLILAIPLAIKDFREHRLPNPMTISALAITLISISLVGLITGQEIKLLWSLGWATGTFFLGYLLARKEAIGMGDIKLLTSMHAIAGYLMPALPLLTLTLGLLIATLTSLVRVFAGRVDMKSAVPLGPYLLLGFFLLTIPTAATTTAAA